MPDTAPKTWVAQSVPVIKDQTTKSESTNKKKGKYIINKITKRLRQKFYPTNLTHHVLWTWCISQSSLWNSYVKICCGRSHTVEQSVLCFLFWVLHANLSREWRKISVLGISLPNHCWNTKKIAKWIFLSSENNTNYNDNMTIQL